MFAAENIRFVLIRTSHPGNIGASARAIKNMGFTQLYLVAPLNFPSPEALARSSGAEDILENAVVVSSLQDAIHDCNLIFGTSARTRALPLPLLDVRESINKAKRFLEQGNKIAFLFGQEKTGLTNEELSFCHYHLYIPCNSNFASLNLAAAVQIITYELYASLLKNENVKQILAPKVSMEEMEKFYCHLEETLVQLKFLNPQNPRQLMRKLRRIFNRISLVQNEMNILRGILSAIQQRNSM